MSDASEPNSTEADHRWIHFKEFNILEFLVEAMYTPPNIESYPYYVTEYKFGIVAGDIRAELIIRLFRNQSINIKGGGMFLP
jgi:hypothetical protein